MANKKCYPSIFWQSDLTPSDVRAASQNSSQTFRQSHILISDALCDCISSQTGFSKLYLNSPKQSSSRYGDTPGSRKRGSIAAPLGGRSPKNTEKENYWQISGGRQRYRSKEGCIYLFYKRQSRNK